MLTSRPESRRPRAVMRAWWPAAGLVLLAFAGLAYTRADADLWGHLRFGLDILRDRTLPSVDPYSFTQDVPWINHEWLSEAIMAAAFATLGVAGIPLLKAALSGAGALLIWRALRGVRIEARVVIVVLLAAGTVHITSSLRPQLWTFLFLLIECRLVTTGVRRDLFWLAPLFAAWVNLHGGWIVGAGVLAVWACVECALDWRAARAWVPVGIACILATLVNPYGWILWKFLGTTVRMERSIDEWQPLTSLPWSHRIAWMAAVAAIVWATARRAREAAATGRWPLDQALPRFAALALLAVLSFRVQRISSLFVATTAMLLAPAFRERWPGRVVVLPFPRPRGEGLVAAALCAVLVAASGAVLTRTVTCVPVPEKARIEFAPASSLHGAEGRLVTHFNWGEYAIWHFGPELRVSIDGRRETVYSDDRFADYLGVILGSERGISRLREWQPEYVWLPLESVATRDWLLANGYRVDVTGAASFIAVRSDRPVLPAPSAPRPCFPG